MNCPRCGRGSLPPDAIYCPYCRTQILADDRDPTPIPIDPEDATLLLVPPSPPAGGSRPVKPAPPAGSSVNPLSPVRPVQLPPPVRPIQTPPSIQKGTRRRNLLLLILAICLVVSGIYGASRFIGSSSSPTPTLTPSPPTSDSIVTKASDGEYIGISDGSSAFDTERPGGIYKREAADKLKAHDTAGANSLWQQALVQDTNDAETLIYLEDQRVLASGNPYITIVVGTILSGNNIGVGRYNLQGAYVAQKEYNDGFKLPANRQVRLLIANSGSQKEDATIVAKEIVQVARTDKTFVGVMGWPLSDPALNVLKVLTGANIPMVSSAGSDELTGKAPHFFRVSAPGKVQASVATEYAEQTLHATRAVVFIDPHNSYSNSLATDFSRQFQADGKTVVTEQYTVGKPQTLVAPLQDVLNSSTTPDLIYFAGYASDVSTLLTDLPTAGPFANLPVVGPNALYEVKGYQSTAHAALSHLRLTAMAYPDEWDVLGLSAQKPMFFADYASAFDPNGRCQNGPYGCTRPDADAMLSYDAMLAILSASRVGLAGGKQSFTPSELQKALTKIRDTQAIQGVSGQISFGSDGNVPNKEVLVLCVARDSTFHLVEANGQFLVGGPIQTLKKPPSSCS